MVRLTEMARGGGCACKLGMGELFALLPDTLVPGGFDTSRVLVDASTRDDAAVYRLTDDEALVVTTDFFTPIVDDPYDFGRIAAANALSDLYAMGSDPLFALNLVAFPRDLLGDGILEEILRGGAAVAADAGIPIMGGHSIDDPEPKYGLVAIGRVHPDEVIANRGARPGDALVLTKPLGTGVVANAIKKGHAPPEVGERAIRSMTTLNRSAAKAMRSAGASAATDVTGYGLLGHARNLARGSEVAISIRVSEVPWIEGARELAAEGFVPGGSRRNLRDVEPDLVVTDGVSELDLLLCADAQTSGGLLIAVAPERVDGLMDELQASGALAWARIGEIEEGEPGTIRIA